FGLDKKTSTKASPAFSKRVADNWKVSLKIDGVLLKEPIGPPSFSVKTGEIFSSTATLEIFMNFHRCLDSGTPLPGRAFCDFGAFFPLGDLPMQASYSSFGSLRQLEALVRIHIEMFLLIEPELAEALAQEPNATPA